jgi:hypothetical protein
MDNDWSSSLTCDYNLYHTLQGQNVARFLHRHYNLEEMQQVTGLDGNSVFVEPIFISPETRDYRLSSEIKMSNGVMPGILQWDPEWSKNE